MKTNLTLLFVFLSLLVSNLYAIENSNFESLHDDPYKGNNFGIAAEYFIDLGPLDPQSGFGLKSFYMHDDQFLLHGRVRTQGILMGILPQGVEPSISDLSEKDRAGYYNHGSKSRRNEIRLSGDYFMNSRIINSTEDIQLDRQRGIGGSVDIYTTVPVKKAMHFGGTAGYYRTHSHVKLGNDVEVAGSFVDSLDEDVSLKGEFKVPATQHGISIGLSMVTTHNKKIAKKNSVETHSSGKRRRFFGEMLIAVHNDIPHLEGVSVYDTSGTGEWKRTHAPFNITNHDDYNNLGLRLGIESYGMNSLVVFGFEGGIKPAPSNIDISERWHVGINVSWGLGYEI